MTTFLPKVEVRSQLSAFMVSTQHYYMLGSAYLHSQNEKQYFDRKGSSVDIISEENVFGGLAVTSDVCL